ncbi:MAG: malonyl-ACP O-methyltransferase BioC [Aeromonadaceae bacterium]
MTEMTAGTVDKQALALRFGHAAQHYDRYARFQQDVGQHLLSLIPDGKHEVVLDLGCGTGFFLQSLQPLSEQLLALDLASGMLHQARQRHQQALFLCGDAEQLPLAAASLDVVFSSLAIQWCHSYTDLLAELYRVIRPGGYLVFATLCQGSLDELRRAWACLDSFDHVNHFVPEPQLRTWSEQQGFRCVHWESRKHGLQYQNLRDLLMGLKGIGASQVSGVRQGGLGGRERLRRLECAYEQQRDLSGFLPLSYEVCYGVLVR